MPYQRTCGILLNVVSFWFLFARTMQVRTLEWLFYKFMQQIVSVSHVYRLYPFLMFMQHQCNLLFFLTRFFSSFSFCHGGGSCNLQDEVQVILFITFLWFCLTPNRFVPLSIQVVWRSRRLQLEQSRRRLVDCESTIVYVSTVGIASFFFIQWSQLN